MLVHYGSGPINNCVLSADTQANCVPLVCYNYAQVYAIRSNDDGKTWSPPREIVNCFDILRLVYSSETVASN